MELSFIKFSWLDYTFFFCILVISVIIGIYYGFYKKQETAIDYIFGGKKLLFLPVALSVIANNVSGIVLLSIPADVYRYGISYFFTYITMILAMFTSYLIFTPVFYKLQVTSVFEYLKLRFDGKVSTLGASLYILTNILFQSIVIYTPSIPLSQATRIDVHFISTLICIVSIFYTTLGGIKAVVYSDSFQAILMISSLLITVCVGIYKCGGIQNILLSSYENKRLSVSYEWDLTKRNNLWSVTIGAYVVWSQLMGVNQIYIQKYLSLPTYSGIIKVLILASVGIFTIGFMANFLGLIIYTEYAGCDPFEAGILNKLDELVPYYVNDLSKIVPGISGLFISGIVSASLSTISAYLNSLSATIYKDFIAIYTPETISQKQVTTILKVICLILGCISTALVLVFTKLDGLISVTYLVGGITSGTILGLFTVGVLFPMVNNNAAFYGGITSLLMTSSLAFGNLWYQLNGQVIFQKLPVSIGSCTNLSTTLYNITDFTIDYKPANIPYIFNIAFYWYAPFGIIVCVLVCLLTSLITKENKILNEELFSPIIHRFLMRNPDKYKSSTKIVEYVSIENALGILDVSEKEFV